MAILNESLEANFSSRAIMSLIHEQGVTGTLGTQAGVLYSFTKSLSANFTGQDALEMYDWIQNTSVEDRLYITDSLVRYRLFGITAVADISDSVDQTVVSQLSATGVFDEDLTPSKLATAALTSILDASDELFPSLAEAITETLNVIDSLESRQILAYTLMDELVALAEVGHSTVHFTQYVTDVGVFVDAIGTLGGVQNADLSDELTARAYIFARNFLSTAWVLNTESGGVSEYDNFEFNSLTEHAGNVFGTSPEGIYVLTGDTDEGRDIDAEIEFGFSDLGIKQRKRVSDIYFGYTGGDLAALVTTYNEPTDVYEYQAELRVGQAPRNNRIRPGRGLNSRFWKVNIKNVGGSDFKLLDVDFYVAPSTRRL